MYFFLLLALVAVLCYLVYVKSDLHKARKNLESATQIATLCQAYILECRGHLIFLVQDAIMNQATPPSNASALEIQIATLTLNMHADFEKRYNLMLYGSGAKTYVKDRQNQNE